jgi:hypothetical protein
MTTIKSSMAILMAVTLLACNKGSNSSESTANQNMDMALPKLKDVDSKTVTADTSSPSDRLPLQGTQPLIDWDKKIIKTADINLELKEYASYNKNIHTSLKMYGAYIASEQQQQTGYKVENTMSIKVPVDRFEDLMNALPVEGAKVLQKQISTQDVSGEVVDTKARMEAKKQVRERYLNLLKQAKNMKEILEVHKEINAMQEDIEAGSGRVDYLVHQAAYSTINLTYFQYLNGTTSTDVSPSFLTRLKEAFNNGVSVITGLTLALVTIWPLIFAGIFAWFLLKKLRIVKAGKQT